MNRKALGSAVFLGMFAWFIAIYKVGGQTVGTVCLIAAAAIGTLTFVGVYLLRQRGLFGPAQRRVVWQSSAVTATLLLLAAGGFYST